MTRVRLTIHRGWEHQMFRTTATKELVAYHTSKLTASSIKQAPRRIGSRSSWNSIKNMIEGYVENSLEGWYGNVVIERHPDVMHAMLLERGFTDRGGRRHPGRRFLKSALLKARVE